MFAAPLKLASVALSASLAWSGAPAPEDITPDSANSARFGVEQEGKSLRDAGADRQAAELFWSKGVALKDPVLIVDAAETWTAVADEERSIEAAQTGILQAKVALDMLYFLRDGAISSRWQPLDPAHFNTVIGRAEAAIRSAEAVIAAIEDEQRRALEGPSEPEEPVRASKPGTGLIAGGSVAVVLGLGGAGLGITGLLLGARAQSEVEDPTVYEPEHSAAEARGRTANVLAGVGLGVAALGVSVGAALLVVGVNKRKRAGPDAGPDAGPGASARLRSPALPLIVPSIGPQGAGLNLVGSF